MAVKNPGYPQWTPGFSHNNQSARDKRMGMIVFFFFLNTEFLILSVGVSLAPQRGARASAVKLKPLKHKVKI